MRKIIGLVLVLVILGQVSRAQLIKPVSWSFSVSPVKTNVGMYEVHMKAAVRDGWKIYSQSTPDNGPERTMIKFIPNTNILLGGIVKEVGAKTIKYEEVFGVDIHYFEKKVDFVQIVKLKSANGDRIIKGRIKYMSCDENQCISDEVEFNIPLK